jgi:ethanolamine ammonia-lyase small subunit
LDYPAAAAKLGWLLREALQRQLSGVALKDQADLLLE